MSDRVVNVSKDLSAEGQRVASSVISRIENSFPADARFNASPHDGGVRILIRWPLHDDAARPNKSSRMIHLEITEAAFEDRFTSTADSASSLDAVAEFVRIKLKTFDAEHDTQAGASAPTVRWLFTSDLHKGG